MLIFNGCHPPPSILPVSRCARGFRFLSHFRGSHHLRGLAAPTLTVHARNGGSDKGAGDFSGSRDDGARKEDPYEGLWKSKVFSSEVVMKELDQIVSQMMQLSQMSHRFPEFDLEGKKMYLSKMEEMVDRYEVFMKRLELSDDPYSKEYLRFMNAQMLNGGFTLQTMFLGVKQSTRDYKNWVAEEEKAIVDPLRHQQFLQWFKAQWSQSALGKLDMSQLAALQSSSPQIFLQAQKDPQFWMAMKEISSKPTPEVMAQWAEHPNIGPFVKEMMRTMDRGS